MQPPSPQPVLTSLPQELRAGDLLSVNVQTDLAAGTLLFYVLTGIVGNVPTRITIGQTGNPPAGGVAVDASGNAAFTVASTVTAAWQAGRYQWIAFAVDTGSNRSELAQGEIRITPDPAGTLPADPRSYNRRLLDQLRAVLQGKALDDVAMYKIGQRELTKIPIRDLLYWEGVVEARVRRERIAAGESVPTRTVGIAFGGR